MAVAVRISFCEYNENTTVYEIRKDFSILETAEKIVKNYRPTSNDGRIAKFDAIIALALGGTNNEKISNIITAGQSTWRQNLKSAFGIKRQGTHKTPDEIKESITKEIDALIDDINNNVDTYTLKDIYNKIKMLENKKDSMGKESLFDKDSLDEFLEFFATGTKEGGTQMSSKNENCDIDINDIISNAFSTNKQVIFTGAPGTGKTYAVRNYVEQQCKEHGYDESHYKFVQFHPSYDYTDFVEGLRPVQLDENGAPTFVRLDGIFKAFCRQIAERNQKSAKETYYFIIDEINRADLAKVFGELMFGLEEGYRGKKFDTQYQNLPTYQVDPDTKQVTQLKAENDVFKDGFYIPENLYIIGTMNDIDRSVDSIDFALRRRFAWVEIKANDIMETSLKSMLKNKLDEENIKHLAKRIIAMNEVISGEEGEIGKRFYLTEAYHIGPAYFKNVVNAEKLKGIFDGNITSILKEYTRGRDAESVEEFIKACRNELLRETGESDDAGEQ